MAGPTAGLVPVPRADFEAEGSVSVGSQHVSVISSMSAILRDLLNWSASDPWFHCLSFVFSAWIDTLCTFSYNAMGFRLTPTVVTLGGLWIDVSTD